MHAQTVKAGGGQEFSVVEKRYDNAVKSAFGDNDIVKRVTNYNISQQKVGGYVKTVTAMAIASAIGYATAGLGTGAVASLGVGTTAAKTAGVVLGMAKGAAGFMAATAVTDGVIAPLTKHSTLKVFSEKGIVDYLKTAGTTTNWKEVGMSIGNAGGMALLFGGVSIPVQGLCKIVGASAIQTALANAGTMIATGEAVEYCMSGELTIDGAIFNVLLAVTTAGIQIVQIKAQEAANAQAMQQLKGSIEMSKELLGIKPDQVLSAEELTEIYHQKVDNIIENQTPESNKSGVTQLSLDWNRGAYQRLMAHLDLANQMATESGAQSTTGTASQGNRPATTPTTGQGTASQGEQTTAPTMPSRPAAGIIDGEVRADIHQNPQTLSKSSATDLGFEPTNRSNGTKQADGVGTQEAKVVPINGKKSYQAPTSTETEITTQQDVAAGGITPKGPSLWERIGNGVKGLFSGKSNSSAELTTLDLTQTQKVDANTLAEMGFEKADPSKYFSDMGTYYISKYPDGKVYQQILVAEDGTVLRSQVHNQKGYLIQTQTNNSEFTGKAEIETKNYTYTKEGEAPTLETNTTPIKQAETTTARLAEQRVVSDNSPVTVENLRNVLGIENGEYTQITSSKGNLFEVLNKHVENGETLSVYKSKDGSHILSVFEGKDGKVSKVIVSDVKTGENTRIENGSNQIGKMKAVIDETIQEYKQAAISNLPNVPIGERMAQYDTGSITEIQGTKGKNTTIRNQEGKILAVIEGEGANAKLVRSAYTEYSYGTLKDVLQMAATDMDVPILKAVEAELIERGYTVEFQTNSRNEIVGVDIKDSSPITPKQGNKYIDPLIQKARDMVASGDYEIAYGESEDAVITYIKNKNTGNPELEIFEYKNQSEGIAVMERTYDGNTEVSSKATYSDGETADVSWDGDKGTLTRRDANGNIIKPSSDDSGTAYGAILPGVPQLIKWLNKVLSSDSQSVSKTEYEAAQKSTPIESRQSSGNTTSAEFTLPQLSGRLRQAAESMPESVRPEFMEQVENITTVEAAEKALADAKTGYEAKYLQMRLRDIDNPTVKEIAARAESAVRTLPEELPDYSPVVDSSESQLQDGVQASSSQSNTVNGQQVQVQTDNYAPGSREALLTSEFPTEYNLEAFKQWGREQGLTVYESGRPGRRKAVFLQGDNVVRTINEDMNNPGKVYDDRVTIYDENGNVKDGQVKYYDDKKPAIGINYKDGVGFEIEAKMGDDGLWHDSYTGEVIANNPITGKPQLQVHQAEVKPDFSNAGLGDEPVLSASYAGKTPTAGKPTVEDIVAKYEDPDVNGFSDTKDLPNGQGTRTDYTRGDDIVLTVFKDSNGKITSTLENIYDNNGQLVKTVETKPDGTVTETPVIPSSTKTQVSSTGKGTSLGENLMLNEQLQAKTRNVLQEVLGENISVEDVNILLRNAIRGADGNYEVAARRLENFAKANDLVQSLLIEKNPENSGFLLDNIDDINSMLSKENRRTLGPDKFDLIPTLNEKTLPKLLNAASDPIQFRETAIEMIYNSKPHTVQFGERTVEVSSSDVFAAVTGNMSLSFYLEGNSAAFERTVASLVELPKLETGKQYYASIADGILSQRPELVEIAHEYDNYLKAEKLANPNKPTGEICKSFFDNLEATGRLPKTIELKTIVPDENAFADPRSTLNLFERGLTEGSKTASRQSTPTTIGTETSTASSSSSLTMPEQSKSSKGATQTIVDLGYARQSL